MTAEQLPQLVALLVEVVLNGSYKREPQRFIALVQRLVSASLALLKTRGVPDDPLTRGLDLVERFVVVAERMADAALVVRIGHVDPAVQCQQHPFNTTHARTERMTKSLYDAAAALMDAHHEGKDPTHEQWQDLCQMLLRTQDHREFHPPTQAEVFGLAQEKGWHSKQDSLIRFLTVNKAHEEIIEHARATWLATRVALIHAEASEAMELLRRPAGVSAPEWEDELADIGLRLKDLAEDTGVNLAVAEARKHARNKTREQTHGGKVL